MKKPEQNSNIDFRPFLQKKFSSYPFFKSLIKRNIAITRATKGANILLPFGSGVSAHVYAFFENEGKSKYSPDQHAVVVVS